jgi:hypothetical protein
MDTMYFRKTLGVMVFRDWIKKENLLWYYVPYETIVLYEKGINELKSRGFEILGIVVDGKKGLNRRFKEPTQMCQFHQIQIVKRYITSNPKLEAGIELKELTEKLTKTDRPSFEYWLNRWFLKWKDFLNERTVNPQTGMKTFTHTRLRSAYRSLKTNLPYLFVYLDHLKMNMPNTTNSLEGSFAHIKDKVRLHRGLKLERKKKLIDELLKKK